MTSRSYFIARGAIERAALHILWGVVLHPGRTAHLLRQRQPLHGSAFPRGRRSRRCDSGSFQAEFERLAAGRSVASADRAWSAGRPGDRNHRRNRRLAHAGRSPAPQPLRCVLFEPVSVFFGTACVISGERGIVAGQRNDARDFITDRRSTALSRACGTALSVYGSAGAVDINTAQAATLQAVGLSAADAATIVQKPDRTSDPRLSASLRAIAQSLGPAGSRLRIGGQTMFTLRATARLGKPDGKLSDLRRTVARLVKFNFPGNPQKKPVGFEVVRWFDRT